ncbi:MAG: CBS domain-containing protein [Rudaea sp.]
MKKGRDDHDVAMESEAQGPAAQETHRKDPLIQLMFFQASREPAALQARPEPLQPLTGGFAPLRNSLASGSARFELPQPGPAGPVQLDSLATEVMTDLRRVTPVTIGPDTPVVEANRVMIARGVRALFVVEPRRVRGIVTATDILGERPIQIAQERSIHYDEVVVADIMTPSERLEVLDLHDVVRARIGDIIATLRLAGRQHALVVDGATTRSATICGMFSLTQIARRLGLPPQQVHDIARTFAEIEALIAS